MSSTIDDIRYHIRKSLDLKNNEFQLDPNIHINDCLYVKLDSVPNLSRNEKRKLYKSTPHLFRNMKGDCIVGHYKYLKLRLLIYSKYFENHILYLKNWSFSGLSEEEKKEIALKANMFEFSMSLKSIHKYTKQEIYDNMCFIGLNFFSHKDSFMRKWRLFEKNNCNPIIFLNRNRGKPKPHLKKITEKHIAHIMSEWREGNDSEMILESLNQLCEDNKLKYISRSSIKKIIAEPFNIATSGVERYGDDFFNNKVNGFIRRIRTEFKLQIIEADGSRFQIPYKKDTDERYKVGFLTLYVVIDVGSGKIIGFYLDDFENKEMSLMSFYMSFKEVNYLPELLRIDHSSAHKSQRFQRFMKEAENMGMTTKMCHFARQKSQVENFFRWFPEKICKNHRLYTGLGIRATDRNIKMSDQNVKKAINSKILPNRKQTIAICSNMIKSWNNRENSTGKTPNSIFNKLKIQNAKFIEEHQIAFLTWKRKIRKSFKRNSISIHSKSHGMREYYFTDENTIFANFENELQIFYLEHYPDHIHVFDMKDNYQGKALLKTKIRDNPNTYSIEERESLFNQTSLMNRLKKKAKEQIAHQNKILSEMKKVVPFTKAAGLETNKEFLATEEQEYFKKTYSVSSHEEELENYEEIKKDNSSFLKYLNKNVKKSSSDYSNKVIKDVL